MQEIQISDKMKEIILKATADIDTYVCKTLIEVCKNIPDMPDEKDIILQNIVAHSFSCVLVGLTKMFTIDEERLSCMNNILQATWHQSLKTIEFEKEIKQAVMERIDGICNTDTNTSETEQGLASTADSDLNQPESDNQRTSGAQE